MSAEDGKIEAGGPELDPLTPREQDNQLAAVLAQLAAASARQTEVLEKIDERLVKLEEQGAGTIDKPDHVPEPDGVEFPLWHDMNNTQRAAWIRAHEGAAPPPPPEAESEILELGDGLHASFPVPSPEAKEAWAIRAPAIFENIPTDWPISRDDAVEAYSKGGPLWFAAMGSRAHAWLMELPKAWRQEMVAQVTSYAPVEGAALGRDILKAKTDEAKDYSYERNLDYADARREGIVVRPGPGDAVQKD